MPRHERTLSYPKKTAGPGPLWPSGEPWAAITMASGSRSDSKYIDTNTGTFVDLPDGPARVMVPSQHGGYTVMTTYIDPHGHRVWKVAPKKSATARRSDDTIRLDYELEPMFQRYRNESSSADRGETCLANVVLGDSRYVVRFKMPKWNVPVSMLQDHKVAIRYAEELGVPCSKHAHVLRADRFRTLAAKFSREWNEVVELACKLFGSQGSYVSGVYREHFPPEVKDRLRFLAHGGHMLGNAVILHQTLSTTRSPRFR